MVDVFISYRHKKRKVVVPMVRALRALSIDAWFDGHIVNTDEYDLEINQKLNAASSVLVVWCEEALKSRWVLAEARKAYESRRLIQISLGNVVLPVPYNIEPITVFPHFRHVNPIHSRAWEEVVEAIERNTGRKRDKPPLVVVGSHDAGNRPTVIEVIDPLSSAEVLPSIPRARQVNIALAILEERLDVARDKPTKTGEGGVPTTLPRQPKRSRDVGFLNLADIQGELSEWAVDDCELQDFIGRVASVRAAVRDVNDRNSENLDLAASNSCDIFGSVTIHAEVVGDIGEVGCCETGDPSDAQGSTSSSHKLPGDTETSQSGRWSVGPIVTAPSAGYVPSCTIGLEAKYGAAYSYMFDDVALRAIVCGAYTGYDATCEIESCVGVIAAGKLFAIDVSPRAIAALEASSIPADRLEAVLCTGAVPLDHEELSKLWSSVGHQRNSRPLPIYGPESFCLDVLRLKEEQSVMGGEGLVPWSPAPEPGKNAIVFKGDGLIVSAFTTERDAYTGKLGYRFDYRGRSLVVCGDGRSEWAEAQLDADATLQPNCLDELADSEPVGVKVRSDVSSYRLGAFPYETTIGFECAEGDGARGGAGRGHMSDRHGSTDGSIGRHMKLGDFDHNRLGAIISLPLTSREVLVCVP